MIKFLIKRKKILIIVVLLCCFIFLVSGVMAEDENYGLDETAEVGYGGSYSAIEGQTDLSQIIGKIIGAGLAFIGILFFILMIYGGFLWMTAGGNEEKVEKSKKIIIQAIIGLVIVAMAYLVTKFVGETILNSLVG